MTGSERAPIPPELVRMLDADAGKAHGANGPVMASLARILDRHEQLVRERIAAELRALTFPCPTHDTVRTFDHRCIGCQRYAALVGAARLVADEESPGARAVREMRAAGMGDG
jgi:hypothetical protein